MRGSSSFKIAIIATVLFASCQKDSVVPDPAADGSDQVNDIMNVGSKIQLGSTVYMIWDSIVHDLYVNPQFGGFMSYAVNVDAWGGDDLVFSILSDGGLGSGPHAVGKVWCKNDHIAIRSFQVTDTAFYNVDTIMGVVHCTWSCSGITSTDSIISIDPLRTKIVPLAVSDSLEFTDEFHTDTIPLFETNTTYSSGTGSYNYVVTKNRNCHLFPENVEGYIGFVLNEPTGPSRLGWIKIRVNYTGEIKILGMAIQE